MKAQLQGDSMTIYEIFEGRLYPVPVGFDAVLRIVYGDYMKVPSLERIKYEQHASKWALGEEYRYDDKSDEKYFF